MARKTVVVVACDRHRGDVEAVERVEIAIDGDRFGNEGSWRAIAALSRAVEQPGRAGALAAVRDELAPIEADSWAEADELWAAGAPAGTWRDAARSWDERVAAALAWLAATRAR